MAEMTLKKWKQIGSICGYDGTRTASVWSKDADRLRKACPYKLWKKMAQSEWWEVPEASEDDLKDDYPHLVEYGFDTGEIESFDNFCEIKNQWSQPGDYDEDSKTQEAQDIYATSLLSSGYDSVEVFNKAYRGRSKDDQFEIEKIKSVM